MTGPAAYVRAQPIFLYPADWLAKNAERAAQEEAHGLAASRAPTPCSAASTRCWPSTRRPHLASLRTPTLIVRRARRRAGAVLDVRAARRMPSPARPSHIAPWGAHAINVTEPDTFNKLLLDFLSCVPARAEGPRSASRARHRDDGASAPGVDEAAAAPRETGARRADCRCRPVGPRHGLRADARAGAQHPGDRSRAGGQGGAVGHLRPHADPAQPQGPDRPGPRPAEPDLPGLVRGPARRGSLRRPAPDPEPRLARLPGVVSPGARPAGAQRRRRDGDRAGRSSTTAAAACW